MTMPSASARASDFLLWSFPRRLALLPCRHLDWLGHAAAVTLRSPRRLRRSPEDAPLRPTGALVSRTSPADGRITDPRVSKCWSPMRSARSGTTRREGRAAGAGPGRLVCRRDTPRPGRRCPGPQARWTCLPGAGPTRTRDCAQQSGPVRLVCNAESRHADAGVRPVVRQDRNHLEFEWEDAPGSGRSVGRSGALCHWMVFACELLTRAGQQVPAGRDNRRPAAVSFRA